MFLFKLPDESFIWLLRFIYIKLITVLKNNNFKVCSPTRAAIRVASISYFTFYLLPSYFLVIFYFTVATHSAAGSRIGHPLKKTGMQK